MQYFPYVLISQDYINCSGYTNSSLICIRNYYADVKHMRQNRTQSYWVFLQTRSWLLTQAKAK